VPPNWIETLLEGSLGPRLGLKFLHRSDIDLRACISYIFFIKASYLTFIPLLPLLLPWCPPMLITPGYWFPLKLRFEFRILPITFKVLQALTPLFLHNLVCIFVPFRNLLSVSHLSLLPCHFSS